MRLCLAVTGDLEATDAPAGEHAFSSLIVHETGSHVVDSIIQAATGHMLHGC